MRGGYIASSSSLLGREAERERQQREKENMTALFSTDETPSTLLGSDGRRRRSHSTLR